MGGEVGPMRWKNGDGPKRLLPVAQGISVVFAGHILPKTSVLTVLRVASRNR